MPIDVSGTLRQALAKLQAERTRINRQITAVQQALQAGTTASDGARPTAGGTEKRGRKRMSPAERKAVSARMRAYWAKRRRSNTTSGAKKK